MKFGIISDIHSNLEALLETLSFLEGKVDRIICLGDVVGYNASPNECCDIMRRNPYPAVAGNHDYAVVNKIDYNYFVPAAKKAVDWTRQVLSEENRSFLSNLPFYLEFEDFEIVHGSLRDPIREYINTIPIAQITFMKMKKNICFAGHTHRPALLFVKGAAVESFSIVGEAKFALKDHDKTIVNVGAVGQPRDGNPRASLVIYDSETAGVSFYRLSYDIEKTQNKMRKAGLPEPLIDRLALGR